MLESLQKDIELVLDHCSNLIDTYNLWDLEDFIYNNRDLFINDWETVTNKLLNLIVKEDPNIFNKCASYAFTNINCSDHIEITNTNCTIEMSKFESGMTIDCETIARGFINLVKIDGDVNLINTKRIGEKSLYFTSASNCVIHLPKTLKQLNLNAFNYSENQTIQYEGTLEEFKNIYILWLLFKGSCNQLLWWAMVMEA